MIKINLLRKERRPKGPPKKAGVPSVGLPPIQGILVLIVVVVVVIIVVGALYIGQKNRVSNLNNEITGLQGKLDTLKVYVEEVAKIEAKEKEIEMRIRPIQRLNRDRFFIAHVMDDISSAIPQFTWLTSLNLSGANLKIVGQSVSNLLIAEFMENLEKSPYISNVDLEVLEKKKAEEQEVMEFKINASCLNKG